MDICLVGLALPLLVPVSLVVAGLVWLKMGSPILFFQVRPGKNGQPFRIVKFRTMRQAQPEQEEWLSDFDRLTDFGRFLRRTSLDELPEFWCVLKGDMSLVGPRPLLTRYMPYFQEEELVRFTVRPGITGLAQINGRNHSTWDQRLSDDVRYVEHWSPWLDLRILWRTVISVVQRHGVIDDARSAMLNLDEERSRSRRCG